VWIASFPNWTSYDAKSEELFLATNRARSQDSRLIEIPEANFSEFQKVTTSPESNWLGMQLTPGRWLARLYQSKSFDSSAGQAGQFRVSSKI
jgi:hypothetical protein